VIKFVKSRNNKLFVNKPKETVIEHIMDDKTILAAIIISSVSCFLIVFIGISFFINKTHSDDIESYSTKSLSSDSTYYNENSIYYVLGDDGQIYQTIDFKDPVQQYFKHSVRDLNGYTSQSRKLNEVCFQNAE